MLSSWVGKGGMRCSGRGEECLLCYPRSDEKQDGAGQKKQDDNGWDGK